MNVSLQKGWFFISFLILSTQISAQTLQGECIKAGFGIDGYVYANGTEYEGLGTPVNGNNADDWFYDFTIYDGTGRNVIDTTGAAYLRTLLMSGSNAYFAKKMSVPPNSIINGRRWQDATYIKDYYGGTGATDSTSYVTASKNGEPLEDWDTGLHNVVPKNDLIDCFAHLRRDGTAAENPLWIYLGFSRIATSGSSYFDAELFANEVSYDPATGFAPVGTDEGHTAWQFDAAGNITKIGDMIVTVTLNTNNVPDFELRIWVRRFDFNNANPTTFTFGNGFDGASNGSQYGYADILPPLGNEFGCGVTNQKNWSGPPWGTLDDHGDHIFSYSAGQFVEIGLNLYDFGIDPQLITGFDACDLPFSNLIFKARASASFTAQLKDFSGPFYFVALDKLESSALGDSLTCLNPIIPLSVDSVWTDAFYEWSTIDGNILTDMGSINDTIIYVDQPGTYILSSAFMDDCEMSYDTIIIKDYTQDPNADIGSDPIADCNNVIADLYALESGHTYNWTGPNGGTFTGQFISVSDPGIYYLEVTNEFGCTALDSIYVLEFACEEVDPPTIETTNIIDTLPPFFTVPPDISVECFDDILDLGITGNVTDEQDNCDPDIVEAIFTDEYITSGFCIGTGQLNRTWSLTDDCGNLFTATQQIILIDTTPPVFTVPNDITITCEEDYMDLELTGETPEVSDVCDTTGVNISFTDIVTNDFTCNGQTQIQRIWSAVDDCGNIALDTQIIMMVDTIGPEIIGIPLIPFVACDSIPNPPTVTATDNCDPNPTIVFTETTAAATCPNSYVLVRTWTATDNCGNETVITQEMNVEDAVNPIILVFPYDITVSCDSVPDPFEPEVADNCDSEIDIDYSEQEIAGTCEGDYTLIRSWIWIDDCDNEVSSFQTITVQDNTPPTFTVPVDITLSCVSDISDLDLTGNVIDEADNCTSNIGEAVFSDEFDFDCVGTGVIERTWSLVDNCGNVNEQIQTITIIDTVPPTYDMPNDITINCDVDPLDLNITGNAINEFDDCDTTLGLVTYEDVVVVNPDCSLEQTITRTWTLADDCGNVTTHLQIISIVDTIPPVFEMPADVTIDCNLDNEDFDIVGEAVNASDNCDENLGAITYSDTFIGDDNCIGSGIIERIWSLADECGNTISHTQVIELIDTIPPIFTVPTDVSISCEQNPNDLDLTGDVEDEFDNCYSALGEAVYSDSVIVNSPCEGSNVIYRTWTLEDGCGNITTSLQVISVEDTIPPVITIPNDITLDCFSELSDSTVVGVAEVISDNCSSNFWAVSYIDSVLVNDSCNYSIQRAWLGTDACGNVAVDTQLIFIIDDVAPVFNTQPLDTIINCDVIPTVPVLTATDNCEGLVDIVFNENITAGSCDNNYTIIRTWDATDKCGNTFSFSQNIIVQDTIAPVFNESLDTMTVGCDSIPPVPTLTASDNCDSSVIVLFEESIIPGSCANNYILVRTWTATDQCGNETIISQELEVQDFAEPIILVFPPNMTVSCDSVPAVETQSVEDNCDADITLDFDETITEGNCPSNYVISRTWSWTDNCNNVSSHTQTITVIDNSAPIFTAPDSITVDCTIDIDVLGFTGNVTGELDNCSDVVGNATYQDSVITEGFCNGSFMVKRTWTLSDSCGNSTSDIQIITVSDTLAPSFTVPEDVIINCNKEPTDLDLTGDVTDESDLCDSSIGEATYTDSTVVDVICEGASVIYRTWVLVDDCGNEFKAIQSIIIQDTQAPTFSLVPADTIVSCDSIPAVIDPVVIDSCGSTFTVDFKEENISVNCGNDFTIKRTWVALDNCGNQDSVIQLITVRDTVAPLLAIAPSDTTLNCEDLPVVPTLDFSDNCSDTVYVNFLETTTDGACIDIQIVTRTWVATDDCGNETTVTQQITLNHCSPEAQVSLPADTSLCVDESIDFEATLTGGYTNPVFQWQFTTDTTQTWNDIVGATNSTFSIDVIEFDDEGYYQVLISNDINDIYDTLCSVISDKVLLQVLPHAPPTNLLEEICDGDSVLFIANYVTVAGQYIDTLVAANGCDSVVTLDLTVHPIYEITIADTICFEDTYTHGDSTYNETGSYSFTFETIEGCDSLVHLNLLVKEKILTERVEEMCDGDSVLFTSNYIFIAGQYADTLIAADGCDSIVNLDLTVHPIYELTIADTICFEDSYTHGDMTYTTSGSYDFTFETIEGCDSLVHLDLFVKEKILTERVEEMCDGDSVLFTTDYIFIAGQYADTLIAVDGCDSIVNLVLTVHPIYELTIVDTICFEDTYTHGDSTYNETGSYSFTFETIEGCDSLVHLNLLVKEKILTERVEEMCDGDSVLFTSNYIFIAGQYADTLIAADGCDSIVNLDLTVHPIYELTIADTICFEDTYTHGDMTYTTSGSYDFTFETVEGCDSLVHLDLFVKEKILTERIEEMCDGDSVLFTSNYIFIAGQYADTLIAAEGCDSIVNLDLTVHPIYELTIADTICFEDTYTHGDSTYNETGSYSFTFETIEGCDSLVHLNLLVKEKILTERVEEMCDGDSVLFTSNYIFIAGQYADTLTAADGCDSIVNLDLTVHPIYELTIADTICFEDTYTHGDMTYNTSGSYDFTFETVEGCDSLVHLDLFVKEKIETDLVEEICEGDTLLFTTGFVTVAGQYADTLIAADGCDSIVNLDLTVHPIYELTIADTICFEDTYTHGDSTYNETGSYDFIFQTIEGCDSLVHLNLLVKEKILTERVEEMCNGDSVLFTTDYIFIAGQYADTLIAADGCDSIVNLDLTVHPIYELTISDTICFEDTYTHGDSTYNETGSYSFTFETIEGCDSLVHLNLLVKEKIRTERVEEMCDGDSVLFTSNYIFIAGQYADTLIAADGCDSIVNLDLTVHPIYEITIADTICFEDTYTHGDSTYNETGSYDFIFQTIEGCDSLVHLDLLVKEKILTERVEEMCDGDSVLFTSNYIFIAGQYADTLIAADGCDSIVNLDLTVHPIYELTIADTICFEDTYTHGDMTYDTTGSYSFVFETVEGCDSLVHLDLFVKEKIETNLVEEICEGDTLLFTTSFVTIAGQYADTLIAADGCDSIVNLDLTVHPIYELTIADTICFEDTYTHGDSTYNETGSYDFIFQTIEGCDSLVHLNLLVKEKILTERVEEMCDGDSVLFTTDYIFIAGQYADTLIAADGCDSIVNLDLTVHPIYELTIADTICFEDTYTHGDMTYNTSGSYDFTFETIEGCDSLVHLNLFVKEKIETDLIEEICEGDTLLFTTGFVTVAGQYADTLIAADGCDSIVNLDLTVHPIYEITIADTICFEDTYTHGDSIYNETGSYDFIFQTIEGCDSLVHLNLLVKEKILTERVEEICDGDSVLFTTDYIFIAGQYADTLIAADGCDSIVNLDLTVHPIYELTIADTICFEDTYTHGDITYDTTGSYSFVFETVEGCDSLVHLNLVVKEKILTELVEEICEGDSLMFTTNYVFDAGQYADTLIAADGCDSIVNLELIINPIFEENHTATICAGASFEFGDSTFTESGTYDFVFQSTKDCDSLVHLELIVEPWIEENLNDEICQGDSILFNGQILNTTGIFTDTLIASNGCDSVVIMDLVVHPIFEIFHADTICAEKEYVFGDSIYATTGAYDFVFQTINGCDSLVHLDLLVNQPIDSTLNEQLCDGDSIFFAGTYFSITGNYTDSLTAANGCDSIVTLNLVVYPIYEEFVEHSMCIGDSLVFGNTTYLETGTHDFTFQSINGCDSLVHLDLVVNDVILTPFEDYICEGDSVLFQNEFLNQTGFYTDTLVSITGCDSVVTMDLIVHPIYEISHADTICNGDDYVFGNDTYTESGSHTFTFQTIEGCDSIVHLDLLVNEPIDSILNEGICEGDSLLFANQNLSIAGQYTDTLIAANGCDSVVVLNLEVYPVYEEFFAQTICIGDSIVFGNTSYFETGTHDFVFQSINGCDSLVHLDLVVNDVILTPFEDSICEGDSVLFQNGFLNQTGFYTDTLVSASGCDSVVTMDLIVHPIYEINHADTICNGENYVFGNDTYTESGAHTFTFQTVNGCDSIVHLDLLVKEPIDTILNQGICEGDSLLFAGQDLNSAGQYTDTLTAANGCDSVVILNLVVHPIYEEFFAQTICIGDSIVFGNTTYFETGTHDFIFQSINGCDSLVHLDLVVNSVILNPFEESICEGDSIFFQNEFLNQTGFYTDTLVSESGCDSVVTMDLIVHPIYEINHADTICNGENYVFGNSTYTVSGSHTFTFQTVNGCDSIVHLDLLVNEPIDTILNEGICEGDTLLFANEILTNAGQYTDTLVAANGCDSVVVLNLEVYPVYEEFFAQTICIGDSIVFGNTTYFETGTHDFTFQSINGCDSLVHLDLVVNSVILSPFEDSICEGDSILFQNEYLSQAGQYSDTLLSVSGCDSVVTLDLTVHPIYEINHADTICNGENYVFGNDTYTVSGSHTFTFQTVNGCDSIVHLDLVVNEAIDTLLNEGICEGDSLLFANENLTIAGQYTDTLVAANGCDSVVVLNLEVHPVYEEFFAQTICIGDSIVFGNTTYFETGTHDFTFQSINGCDSLVHLDLVVNSVILSPFEDSICEGDSILFQNEYLSQAGQYSDTLLSVSGCDSVVTLDLIVHPIYEINHADTICNGENYIFGNDTYTVSGSHTFTFQTVNGCDSIVHLDLLVNDPIVTNLANDICEGDTVLFAGQSLIQTGTYTDSLIAINGCDSIVIYNLTVHQNFEETLMVDLCEGSPYQGVVYPNDTILVDSLQSIWGCDSVLITEILIKTEIIDSIQVTICLGELYQGIAYSSDTTLTFNGTSVNGCDSTFNTFINVNLPSDSLIQVEICEGEELVVGNETYSVSGSYVQNVTATNGCDSTINIELIVWENYEDVFVSTLCSGDSLNGNVYFANTILVDSLQTIHGCDSIEVNQIIVYQPTEETNNIQLCEGVPYQGVVYANDTILIDSLQNYVGCDSVIIYEITIVQDIMDSIAQTICYGENWNGNPYFADTIFVNNYTSVGGCDSIVTTHLEVLPLAQDTLYFEICDGENIIAGGATQTQSGTYIDNYTAANGCDSTLVSILTVYPNYNESSVLEICQGDSAMIFGNYETVAGNYFENNTSVNGCDSIITVTLNVTDPQMSSQVLFLCEGDSLLLGGAMQTTGGEFIDTLSNIVGCDSVVTTTLVFVPEIITEYSLNICEGDGWLIGDSTYFVSGNYADTLISHYGCDSIINVELNVHPVYEFTQDIEICEGEQFIAGGAIQTTSGTYTDNYTTVNGCDSIWITNLLVHPKSTTALEFFFCEGESYFAGGAEQTTSGTYSDLYQNVNGCDSIVTTELIFHSIYMVEQSYTICENDSIFLAGAFQNADGVFTDSLTSINGCDSIITHTLTISDEQVEFEFEETICLGDSIFIANEWQFTSGTFVETFNPSNGCDSIVTTILNVLSPNNAVWEGAEICYGDEVQLFIESTGDIENINWYPSSSLSCDDCPNPVAFPDVTTTYTITYPSGCDERIFEAEVTVIVNDPAEVEVVEEEINIIQGDSVILMVIDVDTNFTYTWTDGSGNVICTNCTSVIVQPNSSTNYTVTAYDPNNACPGTANTIVFVKKATCEDGTLEVSNVIFPQSGGYGDHLEIQYDRVEINVLRIYNRWGELVFETTDIENKWDGTFRGQLLNPGVYVYYILGVCPDEKRTKFMYSGNVTLIH